MVTCKFCFREFREQDYLETHIQNQHSELDPSCAFCYKHFNLYDSLRAHLNYYGRDECHQAHRERGCEFCFAAFDCTADRDAHLEQCAPYRNKPLVKKYADQQQFKPLESPFNKPTHRSNATYPNVANALALDAEFVGVGYRGQQDAVAKICVIDYEENIVYESYVIPEEPVVDYRYEFSGVTEEDLKTGKPFSVVKKELESVLLSSRLIIGHNVRHDLDLLHYKHPKENIRDTAYYTPLLKPGRLSKKLKVLAKNFLGYSIQVGPHDPYEDCVAALRVYKKFQSAWERRIILGVEHQKFRSYKDQKKKVTQKTIVGFSSPSTSPIWPIFLPQSSNSTVSPSSSPTSTTTSAFNGIWCYNFSGAVHFNQSSSPTSSISSIGSMGSMSDFVPRTVPFQSYY